MLLKKLYLELTDKCNLNCKMCYRKSWEQNFCDMKDDLLIKLVNELKTHTKLKEIVIGGIGEPTFSKNFKMALELLKDYKLTVTTNGTLMDKELLEYLIKYVDVVTISIDGLFDKYEEIRGSKLDLIIENINLLNKLKYKFSSKTPLVDIQFVLSNENLKEIFKVMDLASDLKANKFIISNIIPQSEENKDNILYGRYENKSIKDLFNELTVHAMHKGIKISLPNYELKTIRKCDFMENHAAFICASGDVAPCYRFSHHYTEYVFGRKKEIEKFIFGNIKNDTLLNIWNNIEYKNFRYRILNNKYPSCIDCDLVDGCDHVNDAESDCYGLSPTCGDCLWSREFVQCP
ncbi:radical SAM protein [Clostridium carboxidivorans P7]|uniref:Radical SAM domain protein n=1 Tax=Clostridium carboxidivorans P7 TaxID=536227 RepID=C6PXE5_9CLOT|nr:tungsten cofactor oxidoreductase radical SAM maturase [Clostridium carboxidivorans]AKN31683.1 radical SAM protein [Clostridium carboxidivorans P7]EET86071.1 Radical SAM domain protein [Clostridium carboxidivorans P7]EFG87493.1 radical SAM domain protein [Clostridium carboxidivorans P7]